MTMVIWTSSELPDSGFGLFDYQTNTAVDKLAQGQGAAAARDDASAPCRRTPRPWACCARSPTARELNMAYPPRPTDPKIAWEPDWNVKIRVKSMTTTMMGMEGGMGGMGGMDGAGDDDEMTDAPPPADGEQAAPADRAEEEEKEVQPVRRR